MKVGVNYWGSKAGVRMWRADEWDEASVEADVAALAAQGVELMRVFPTWSEFQPLMRCKKFQGKFGTILREGTDEEIFDPLWLDPGAMVRFGRLCDFAEAHGVKLMVSLVTGWMSGRLFAPRIVENLNLITDPEALMWEGRFARAFVRSTKDRKAIVAWDLGNECNCMGAVEGPAQAWNWLNTMSSAIRMEDPSRPVVSGMHSQTSNAYGPQWEGANWWSLQMQGELLDVLTPHPYPASFRIEANRGPFNSFRNALHPLSQCLFYSAVSGKPAFPQEVGSLGPRMSPEWMAAAGMRQQMFACWSHGLRAYLWWCAFDQLHLGYPPFTTCAAERELGILRADAPRTPKPQALALKAFRAFRDSLPFDALPPRRTDAFCLVSEREEFYHQAFGALMLSKMAGFDVEFTPADSRPLPDSRFYILPSGKDWDTYGQQTWEALVEKVRGGATLLVSRGGSAGYSNWLEFTGLEQVTCHKARSVKFSFEGREMSFTDDFTAEQRPVDCEVVALDSDSNVVVSERRLGAGKVIAVNFALEKCIIERESEVADNSFSNELWRIYAFAAREAGVERVVSRTDPRVVFTEHPQGGASSPSEPLALVTALNTRDAPVTLPISVRGKVGRVWNGSFADGQLSIRANDGCVFEVLGVSGAVLRPAGNGRVSIPFDTDYGEACASPEVSGCHHFEIAPPRTGCSGGSDAVVKATDFGLSEASTDNASAINAALAEAKRIGASRVELAPGTYRCYNLAVSGEAQNNFAGSGEAQNQGGGSGAQSPSFPGIALSAFTDFTFDGCGATLVFRRPPTFPMIPAWDHDSSRANFVIRNCQRTRIGNFSMDWDWHEMPLATCAKVAAVHVDDSADNASFCDFELLGHGDRHPYFGKLFPVQRTQPMTPDFQHFLPGPQWWHGTYEGESPVKTEWLSPTRVRVWPAVADPAAPRWTGPNARTFTPEMNRQWAAQMKPGDCVRIAHAYYGKGGFALDSNSDFELHDVRVYSCFGFGVYIKGTQTRWVLRNVVFEPRDWRHPISSTADTVHFVRSCGKALIDNLKVRLEADDAINAHDRFTVARRVGERELEVILERGARYFMPAVGDEVELRDPGFGAIGWRGKVAALDGERIVFDRPVPEKAPEEGYWLVFDRTASSDGLIVRNCTFDDMESRVLVNVSDVTIENCTFRRTNCDALRCMADYGLQWWCEGMGTRNVVIRDCLFENNCVRELVETPWSLGADISCWLGRPDQVDDSRLDRSFISDILVEGCTFRDSLGYFADLRFGTGFTFRNNRIERTGRRGECRETSGSVRLEGVSGVRFENNEFFIPNGAPAPKVFCASPETGWLFLKNNRVYRQAGWPGDTTTNGESRERKLQ